MPTTAFDLNSATVVAGHLRSTFASNLGSSAAARSSSGRINGVPLYAGECHGYSLPSWREALRPREVLHLTPSGVDSPRHESQWPRRSWHGRQRRQKRQGKKRAAASQQTERRTTKET